MTDKGRQIEEIAMKPMIYSAERKKELLCEGEYKGHKFVILSLGNHPTAYVEDKIGAIDYYDIRLDDVEVHGGFTFCGGGHWSEESAKTRWLGWDYAHAGDFAGYYEECEHVYYESKQWTTPEIYEEVKRVIDQLIEVEAKNNSPEGKAVNEMVECGKVKNCDVFDVQKICVALYKSSYRKQSDVAEEIIEMLKAAKPIVKVHFEAYAELIENIAAEYGAEVEK